MVHAMLVMLVEGLVVWLVVVDGLVVVVSLVKLARVMRGLVLGEVMSFVTMLVVVVAVEV